MKRVGCRRMSATARNHLPHGLVFVGFLALYLLTAPGYMWNTDGWTRYLVAVGLVEHGRPILPPSMLPGSYWVVRGPDGSAYSYFGVGQSLAFVPFYLTGKGLTLLAGAATADWPAVLASFLNSVVAALLAVAVFALTRGIGHSPRVALGAAALSGLGTIVWAHSRDNYDHMIETLCLTPTLAILVPALDRRSRRGCVIAGLVFGCGLVTRLSIAFALPGLGLLLAGGPGRPRVTSRRLLDGALFTVGALPAVAVVLLYNWSRFGRPFETGYETKAPHWLGMPIGNGAATLLVSPGRGLLWYVPLVLALPFLARWLYRRRPGLALSLLAISLGYLLAYSQFGGLGLWGWGPYYLLPLMPVVAVGWAEALSRWAILPRAPRLALAGLIAVSVLVQALSATAAYRRTYVEATVAHVPLDQGIDWNPRWSLLLRQGGNLGNAIGHVYHPTPLLSVGEPASHEYRLTHDIGLNTLDWWWVRARYRGARWTWAVPLALGAVLAMSLGGFHRQTTREAAPPA
jgi:hypothetical protein